MTLAPDAVREFLRTRVLVTTQDGTQHERTLAAFSPKSILFLADTQGFEVQVPLAEVATITDARYTCAECGRMTNTRYSEDRCADCYRVWCANDDVPSEQCEEPDCTTRAFYSPGAKKFRCAHHHAKYKTLSGQGVEARVLGIHEQADCRSDDVDSLRHEWRKVKSQWLCKKCKIKHFGQKPAGALF